MSTHSTIVSLFPKSLLIFRRVSLEEGVRERADRLGLDDLGVVVPYGPRVVLVLLVRARAPPDLEMSRFGQVQGHWTGLHWI